MNIVFKFFTLYQMENNAPYTKENPSKEKLHYL